MRPSIDAGRYRRQYAGLRQAAPEQTITLTNVPATTLLQRTMTLVALVCAAAAAWPQVGSSMATNIDYATQLRETEPLAQQGHAVAQFNLGVMYDFGQGTPKLGNMRSNTVMDHNDQTLERLTNLEIKASFTDDLLDAINQTLYRQQQEIDRLRRDLQQLRELSNEAGTGTVRSLLDDLPPHY